MMNDIQQFEEGKTPCEEWKWIFDNNMYLTIILGAMISIINAILVTIF
jgi:hypothetical protein